jgi:type VI secretion system secreted protein VgrG
MGRLSRPLNRDAVKAADDEFYAKHPEFVKDGKRIPLSATDPSQAGLRKEWVELYKKHGGKEEGDDSKQPPKKPDDPVQPCPKPCSCIITSQTVATSPANRARTRIGVGEEVELTVSPGSATWEITSGTGKLSPKSGAKVTYTADDTAGSVTITATKPGCSCTITLTVVEPSSWTMKRRSGTNLRHTHGRPDCGFQGTFFIHPNDVNFYRIRFREKDSQAVASGSYSVFNGVWHGNYPLPDRVGPWLAVISHTDADGSQAGGLDNVYSGDPGAGATNASPPFKVGTMHFPITMQWKVGTGIAHDFGAVRQEHEIFADGRCESRKGGLTEQTKHDDPTSTP